MIANLSSDTRYVKFLASITTVIVLVLVVVNIVISAQVSYWGYELGQLQNRSSHLEEANRLLKQDITRQTSLTKLMDNAYALGYQTGIAYFRLPVSLPVAMGTQSQP